MADHNVDASLTGEAALGANLSGAFVLAAILAGEAALAAPLSGTKPLAAVLAGEAVFLPLWGAVVQVGVVLSGEADLPDSVLNAGFAGAAALTGEANLPDSDLDADWTVASALSGDTDFLANFSGTVPVDAVLAGQAALAGDIMVNGGFALAFAGEGAFRGIMTLAKAVVGPPAPPPPPPPLRAPQPATFTPHYGVSSRRR